jgi:hypothetical protein
MDAVPAAELAEVAAVEVAAVVASVAVAVVAELVLLLLLDSCWRKLNRLEPALLLIEDIAAPFIRE